MVSGDKESCVVIMNKSDYQNKVQQMINDWIRDGIYKVTADNTLDDLKTFKSFLYRNFYGSTNIMKRCCQNQTNLVNFMALLRLINLAVPRI